MAEGIVAYMLPAIWLVLFSGMVTRGSNLEYDFEVSNVPSEITSTKDSTLDITTDHFKKGLRSLKWQWMLESSKATWDLSGKTIPFARNAGIKMWIYNSNPLAEKCLLVCIQERRRRSNGSFRRSDSCFPMSLNFKGWRAVWVTYQNFRGCRPTSSPSTYSSRRKYNRWNIDKFSLTSPTGANAAGTLYIDLLRFVVKMKKPTRDSVVPPLWHKTQTGEIKCTSCDKINNGFSQEDALAIHKRKQFWQQIFRWSLASPSPLPSTTAELADIRDKITKRLVNWYAGEGTTFTRIPRPNPIPNKFLVKRWYSLLDNIDRAHQEFKKFTNAEGILATALFARNSEFGTRESETAGADRKFSSIFYKVLHPLSLEYSIKSRSIEVNHAACEFAKIYKCAEGRNPNDGDVEAVTGKDTSLKNHFNSKYSSGSSIATTPAHSSCSGVSEACFNHVKDAIESVNQKRKEKILKLFDYIKDQGIDKGSALGSNDHAQLGMSGFFHSVFLMRDELNTANKLNDIIGAMKWYSDFGENYQTSFEFNGTTADRLRSVKLFQLLTVLVMPDGTEAQQKEKLRDMQAFKLALENSLRVNKGLGGLIKPDFTSFHHKTFYASAYSPPALHTAALLSYLLQDTAYELDSKIRENLVNALKVFRIVAVRYSTPDAVGARFPGYTQAVLAEHVPAYAYIAANPASTPPVSSLNTNLSEAGMFLRLNDQNAGSLNRQLRDGSVGRMYYLKTLGSLQIMEKVKTLASKGKVAAEKSPEGHWHKQFAGLSIHRRKNWTVTVKGFNKFVWDFESSKDENRYGMYASHGAMLIANSESALSTKDVDKGWDWRKIPGTTVINTDYSHMSMDGDRNYCSDAKCMAGGVTIQGSIPSYYGIFGRNGVFGMAFIKPTYTAPYFSQVTKFNFKKSVFFYDNIIISLGSNIEYSAPAERADKVHTALFQDKMRENPAPRTNPKITSNVYRCNDPITAEHKTTWGAKTSVVLVDVNGNRYYVPDAEEQGLVFHRGRDQSSFKSRKAQTPSSGTYCTAWFNHGIRPSGDKAKYRYVVQVAAEPVGATGKDAVPSNFYEIKQQDANAHVVKFPSANRRGEFHGFVVFPLASSSPITFSEGPLSSVSDQSIIMVEKKSEPDKLYISVTSPQLELTKKSGSPSWCNIGKTNPVSSGDVDETLLYCSKSASQQVRINLRTAPSTVKSLHVGGKDKMSEKNDYLKKGNPSTKLTFENLRNGADTEVSF